VIACRFRVLFLMGLLWTALSTVPAPASAAESIGIRAAQLQRSAEVGGWMLSVDLALTLASRQREAVERGVSLPFTVEFELLRPRWYWWDARTVKAQRTYRISYHALTREFRVSDGDESRAFDNMQAAIAAMSRIRGWRVMDIGLPEPGIEYEPRVRVRLDTSLLPKPLQVNAITNRDWTLQSEWKSVRFNP
jgi:hypothetical protein